MTSRARGPRCGQVAALAGEQPFADRSPRVALGAELPGDGVGLREQPGGAVELAEEGDVAGAGYRKLRSRLSGQCGARAH